MQGNNEELQSLINEMRSKLGDTVHVELIEGIDKPEASAEPQSEPGPAMPDELLSMIAQAAKEALGGSADVMRGQCYHYILNERGEPVHCTDGKKLMEFQDRNGHIVALESFFCRDFHCQVMTYFVVHNPMIGDKPPKPRWVTDATNIGTGDTESRVIAETRDAAMLHQRNTCTAMRRKIAKLAKESRNVDE